MSASPLDRRHSEKGQRPTMIVSGSWRCVSLGWHVYKWIVSRRESQNYRKSTKQISTSSRHKREYLCRNDTAEQCRVTISNCSQQDNPFSSLQIPTGYRCWGTCTRQRKYQYISSTSLCQIKWTQRSIILRINNYLPSLYVENSI